MGWKAVRDHFRIKHIVHILDGHLAIGSAYVSSVLKVDSQGNCELDRAWKDGPFGTYQREIERQRETFVRLFAQPDTFTYSIPVFSFGADDSIEEDLCEEFGWPHVTHRGTLMYENTHFLNRWQAAQALQKNLLLEIQLQERNLANSQQQVAQTQADLAASRAALQLLEQNEQFDGAQPSANRVMYI